jgi:IPT/TIG domain
VIPTISGFSPAGGPVGTSVTISGMSLTQTTSVTFGGVKATSFTVNSNIQVTAIVPTGARTGKIGITTKGGTVTSSGKFTVQ